MQLSSTAFAWGYIHIFTPDSLLFPHFHTLHTVKIIQIDLPLYTTQTWLITQICMIAEIEINPQYYRTKTHERIQRWFFFSGNFTLGILNKIPMKALNIMFGLQEGTRVQAVSKGWSRQVTGDLWHFSMFTLESEDLGFFSYHNTTAASKLSFTSESGNYY